MPNVRPPLRPAATPIFTVTPLGTRLYRVYNKGYPSDSFNPGPSHRFYGGGRFDGTEDDSYPFVYVGDSQEVAICETFMRDIAPMDNGVRAVPRDNVSGRGLVILKPVRDLRFLDLSCSKGLGAYSQDTWLTTAMSSQYAFTRHWGHWIRSMSPADVDGFVWRSFREPSGIAMVLFGDRVNQGGDLVAAPAHEQPLYGDFDSAIGYAFLIDLLAEYGAVLAP